VRAETQRQGEVKPKNKTFRMLKNVPREDGKKQSEKEIVEPTL